MKNCRNPTHIFGGNYSGKTTIINSLRFGVFGLTWGHTIEGVETRYFSSRIRETKRKSLDIDTVYQIDPMIVSICRTIFSSGTPKIEASVSENLKRGLSKSVKSVKLEKQYYTILRNYMGQITEDQLKTIPNLIFSGEDRQNILWTKNLEYFVLSLLISQDDARQLRQMETHLSNMQNELKRLHQDGERISRDVEDKKSILAFLNKSLKDAKQPKISKIISRYKKINVKLQELRMKVLQMNAELREKLKGKTDLLLKLGKIREEFRKLELEEKKIKARRLKSILNPKDPEETHVLRHIYYQKKCPFCLSDLSIEVNDRMTNKMCIVCGKGSAIEINEDLEEIERELSGLTEKVENLEKSRSEFEGILNEEDNKIYEITKILKELSSKESDLQTKMDKMKEVESQLHKREVISDELKEMKREIQYNEKQLSMNKDDQKKIEEERTELIRIYDKAKMTMQKEIDKSINEIESIFSDFVRIATNDEAIASLSPDFIPVLNGRQIFRPEYSSQFERAMMDYAFRFALLSVLANKTKTCPSLVIETPDEVTDDAYIPHLAKAMVSFSSNLSVAITTVCTEMMKHLLKDFKPADRKRRLFSLISMGTKTQKRYYQAHLQSYLGDNA